MGISGLLPFLENATKPCHVSEFRGATVVIDTYCWLHKGAKFSASQLTTSEDPQMYVNYCLKYIKMLQSYNIRPILVFDGKNLPAKADTDAKRRELRAKAKQRAAELLRLGKTMEAQTFLKQCINITPEMASAVIKECHKINVDCIVAPYESDAQLAFFNLKGIAEFVITEDSDLLLFGCSKVMFKLDMRGCGYLVESNKIYTAMKLRPDKYSFEKFRHMCILSGCDYVDSLQGIGLKKAEKFISLTEETNPELFLDKVPRYLNMRQLKVTDEYKENFMVADATFRHQTVFDPFKRKLVPLTDPEVCGTNPKYCKNAGDIFDHEKAYQVALGNLHPSTFKRLDNWTPNEAGSSSIWSGVYKRTESRKEQKAKFRDFFKTTAKVQDNVDEKTKIMEDEQIFRELEYYSSKSVKCEEIEIKEEPKITTETREEGSSPEFTKNPFIIRKKLSKFSLTESDSTLIVKSRYFASSSSKEEEVKVNELSYVENRSSKINIISSDSESNGDQSLPNSEMTSKNENGPCQSLTKTEDKRNDNLCMFLDPCTEKIYDDLSNTKLENHDKSINIIDLSTDEIDAALSNTKLECENRSSKQNISQWGFEGRMLKKRRVGDKFVGFKRKRSDDQPTIQNFFVKMTKK